MGALPLKMLGMRRQVTFPYAFEAFISNELLVVRNKRDRRATVYRVLFACGQLQRFPSVGMICLHSFLQMVFLDNFFHGDMHSGNLLCRFARGSKEVHCCPGRLVPLALFMQAYGRSVKCRT